uniref:Uncharacterized protein n=1 Tax=Oryza sativa subsp. japonica TaxID=39947 RepID=Q5VPN2_ORYSJ|nr:hypothetical protein [Oryza sativa Japonica Group]
MARRPAAGRGGVTVGSSGSCRGRGVDGRQRLWQRGGHDDDGSAAAQTLSRLVPPWLDPVAHDRSMVRTGSGELDGCAASPRFGGSWAAMCGCGVSGTTAYAGVKQEWGLMFAAGDQGLVFAICYGRGVVMVFFHIPHKSPGENLVPAFGRAAAVLRVVSSLRASLRRSSNASMTVDGLFRFKSFHTFGSLGNDDMMQSLPRSSGAGRVKEVAPRWLG